MGVIIFSSSSSHVHPVHALLDLERGRGPSALATAKVLSTLIERRLVELLLTVPHLLSTWGLLGAHVTLNKLFDLRVVGSLPYLVNLELYDLGGIIVFIHRRHPLPLFQLLHLYSAHPQSVNALFDPLGVVESLLRHCFVLDLL